MNFLWSFGLIGLCLGQIQGQSGGDGEYRLCVPQDNLDYCSLMTTELDSQKGEIICVPEENKKDCIELIAKNEADFMSMNPEEIYKTQTSHNDDFVIISQLRFGEYAYRDYQYEAVPVIRKSSGITGLSSLRGKRSCHAGYGKNAAWKLPVALLKESKEVSYSCENIQGQTNPEPELNAISKYFGAACLPGFWSDQSTVNNELKESYKNLCELCANPKTCGKKDKFAKYEGALRCLTENNGDIAWSKMDAVEKYFRLDFAQPLEGVDDYSLLCANGSTVALTASQAERSLCAWAKRPWKAIVASKRIVGDPQRLVKLQGQITHLRNVAQGSGEIPEWYSSVLGFKKGSDMEYHYKPSHVKSPAEYLSNGMLNVTFEQACPKL